MAVTNTLRRALLYVPGSSKRMLDRAATMTVDCAAFDLEDSVTISHKDEARELVRRTLDHPKPHSIHETAVRINSVGSGLAEKDLTSMLDSPYLTTIVVPKVDSASDLRFVHDMVKHSISTTKSFATSSSPRQPISILALIESAKSITNLSEICTATPLLSGLIFAAEDFALDLSITRTPSLTEFLYARSAIVTAARAHNIPSVIDLVCTTYARNPDTDSEASSILKQEAQDGKRLGFNGKQCIHPSQVAPVQAVFSPEPKELVWAVRVSIADEKAARQGRGAWTLDGKMIDAPVVGKAKAIVRKAEQCGMNVKDLIREWHDQEPE
ncbi:citrate lyase beta subunit [Coccidioides immitis RS]|uniref:Citrate lyase beta subunit n=3 Tax=Coccidioides immitis TaxID=5501 RepID=J3KHE4_COCIM|nr:citrate lyase beta subunit [Coccidioides immitis RS]EAS35279.3 citrate lyase beta subunit [Coccidioides immitis RS]KMP00522.1 citrate lyase subunit beta [Coccidioides immitis RMSCC 2394]KMU89525.1 citrate lyase subunit beta (Citrate (pro-3S)-lyase subunit beta) [Coccidioides immitis H538.4]TPX26441.1 hypothetical protein DIZ76_011903 [Coccidioides immitis]